MLKSFLIKSYRKRIKKIMSAGIKKGKKINEKEHYLELKKIAAHYQKRVKIIENNNKREIVKIENYYHKLEKKLNKEIEYIFISQSILNKKNKELDTLINEVQLSDRSRLKSLHEIQRRIGEAIAEDYKITRLEDKHNNFKKSNNVYNIDSKRRTLQNRFAYFLKT